MAKARKVKQVIFEMPDRVGLLSEITAAIAKARVNITALCAYGMDGKAYFMMTTDNNAKAKKALAAIGGKVTVEDLVAVEMPNKAGELQKVAMRIADARVNILYSYGTAGAGKSAICILKTSDDSKAIRAINK